MILYFDNCFSEIHCLWAFLSVNEDVGTTFSSDAYCQLLTFLGFSKSDFKIAKSQSFSLTKSGTLQRREALYGGMPRI